jgi:transcriptional regulator with XRE-family HTH domain
MTISADFGRAVRRVREAKRLSQEQLAESARIHRTYLSGVETGTRNPTLEIVERLAKALDVTPSCLLDGTV